VRQVGYLQELNGDMMFRLFYGSHIKKKIMIINQKMNMVMNNKS
jgi:hypothetical protein